MVNEEREQHKRQNIMPPPSKEDNEEGVMISNSSLDEPLLRSSFLRDDDSSSSVPASSSQSRRRPPPTRNNTAYTTTATPPPPPPPPPRYYDGLPSWETSVLIKALFFLDALGASTWGRFSAIYYNLHGLNASHIGTIEGLRTALPTVSQVVWGILADYCHSRKRIWILTNTVSTVILLTLALPVVYQSFVRILCVSIASSLFVSSGILDAYTLDRLGTTNKMYYGRYRLYASISWGLGSILMGWMTDHFQSFEPNFILFGILSFLMVALVAWKIPNVSTCTADDATSSAEALVVSNETHNLPPSSQEDDEQVDDEEEEDDGRHNHLWELVCLAARPQVIFFLVEVIIMGAAMATVERLLFLYLVNDLHASTLLCGLSVGVNVLFELPIFWYAESVMATLGGHDGMYLTAMVCFFVRVVGYTYLTPATKWYILALEILHGITFACFWTATMDIAKCLVHQTKGSFWRTAIPAAVQMLYSAVGVSLGSVLGGWAMHHYGSRTMYKCTAGIVAATFAVHFVGVIVLRVFWKGASVLPDYHSNDEEDDDTNDINGRDNDDNDNQHHGQHQEEDLQETQVPLISRPVDVEELFTEA